MKIGRLAKLRGWSPVMLYRTLKDAGVKSLKWKTGGSYADAEVDLDEAEAALTDVAKSYLKASKDDPFSLFYEP